MNKKRVYSFEYIRVISCFAVVLLHTCTIAVNTFAPARTVSAAVMVIRNLMMFAVPSFVMVTGALHLDPERPMPLSKIWQKYIKRTVIVLFIFTLIFSIYDGIVQHGSLLTIIADWLKDTFTNGSWLHMWYLYLLLAIYLSLPFFRKVLAVADEKERKYLLLLLFIFQAALPTVNTITGFASGFYILFYSVYPLYMILGYEIHSRKIQIPKTASVLIVLGCSAGLAVFSIFGVLLNNTALISLCTNYASLLVVMDSAALFSLFESADLKKSAIVHQLDRLTFGIYLIHVIFIKLLYTEGKVNPFSAPSGILFIFLEAVIIFLLSGFITALLRKNKWIRKYL